MSKHERLDATILYFEIQVNRTRAGANQVESC